MQDHAPYWRRYFRRYREWQWGRDSLLVAGLMALAIPVGMYLYFGKVDWLLVKAILCGYALAGIIYLLVRAIKTVLVVDEDRNSDYRSVAIKLAHVSQELEDERRKNGLPPTPIIEVKVKDFLVITHLGQANCFVLVYLHNSSLDAEVTLPEYKITLEIEGKLYSGSHLLSAADFQAVNYYEDYDDEGSREPQLVIGTRDEMPDLRSVVTDELPLVRGKFKEGWLAFRVSSVPNWPEYKNVVGTHTTYDEEGEPHEEEEIEVVLLDTSITKFQVSVRDPHGTWHSSDWMPYKKDWRRGVIKKPKPHPES